MRIKSLIRSDIFDLSGDRTFDQPRICLARCRLPFAVAAVRQDCAYHLRLSSLLEGGANGIGGGGGVVGAYVDLFCGAGVAAVVIGAVGDVTADALIGVAGLATRFVGIFVHRCFVLSIFVFLKEGSFAFYYPTEFRFLFIRSKKR